MPYKIPTHASGARRWGWLLLFSVMLMPQARAGTATAPSPDTWYCHINGAAPEAAAPDGDGVVTASFDAPGSMLLYCEPKRETFRPRKDDFQYGKLSMEVKAECSDGAVAHGNIFVKDKDGLWFQSRHCVDLAPGVWQTVEVDLASRAHDLVPEGHSAAWSCLNAATIFAKGFTIFRNESGKVTLSCRNLTRSGERAKPPLHIANLDYPKKGQTHKMLEGRFELSREYFNPFDPAEIRVDAQVVAPDAKETTIPAFFTLDYDRRLYFNRELGTPTGEALWAFRFTPPAPGVYRFRIVARDSSEPPDNEVMTPYLEIDVDPADNPGFVRVCPTDPRYFELSTGEFFFPIGFNIHSVKDTRSESKLQIGYRPDKGTYSYDEYFKEMAANGVNAVEIWMATWSVALEGTSFRPEYYGLGRYNLFNAWRLDHILDSAAAKGIYVHLVLDNHGKMSSHSDQEWDVSPHNTHTPFAVADGAMLENPVDFFTNTEAIRYYLNRNRYIAARWGASTNIFGIELWSEINLVTGHDDAYKDGRSLAWHRMVCEDFTPLDQGAHLITTHTCGDYNNIVKHQKFYELPQIAYVVGDAYRDKTPFVDHMLEHTVRLIDLKKPILVTEYGGKSSAEGFNRLEADLHAGLWTSLFCEQAGTPFLWWHDFIHEKGNYRHFRGFSQFMKGIDPRNKQYASLQISVYSPEGDATSTCSCLATGNEKECLGWVFHKRHMEYFPDTTEPLEVLRDHTVVLRGAVPGDSFTMEFFDTLTGERLGTTRGVAGDEGLKIELPPFTADVAFKIFLEPPLPTAEENPPEGTTRQ